MYNFGETNRILNIFISRLCCPSFAAIAARGAKLHFTLLLRKVLFDNKKGKIERENNDVLTIMSYI